MSPPITRSKKSLQPLANPLKNVPPQHQQKKKVIDDNNFDDSNSIIGTNDIIDSSTPKSMNPGKSDTQRRNNPLNYLSPKVIVTRGKGNEFKKYRNSMAQHEKPVLKSQQQNQIAADYFRNQLNEEILRFSNLIDSWTEFKINNFSNLSSGHKRSINVACAAATLLIASKFIDFKILIENCTNNVNDLNPNDLEEHWSTMYNAVEECDQLFTNLEQLNNGNNSRILLENDQISIKTKEMNTKNNGTNVSDDKKKCLSEQHTENINNLENLDMNLVTDECDNNLTFNIGSKKNANETTFTKKVSKISKKKTKSLKTKR